MALAQALRAVADVAPPALEQFRQELDPTWVEAALAATGTATLRRRRLPAEQVVWLVLGMALYRDRSVVEVAAWLGHAPTSITSRVHVLVDASAAARTRETLDRLWKASDGLSTAYGSAHGL